MGIRFLLLLVAIVAIGFIVRFFFRSSKNIELNRQQKIKTDNMVACQHCGLHIPKTEAIESDGIYYCSREHALKSNDKH